MPAGALAHERAVARDLVLLGLPPKVWTAPVPGPDGAPMPDVAVIGAGMYGIAAAAALTFKGVRTLLLDRAPAGQEGPWLTYARMRTLRSPKHLPGIALGIPSLTFRAWFEARLGADAWEALGKIPNGMWQDYLTWLRRVLALGGRSGAEVAAIEPHAGRVTLRLADGGVLHARRVVLATGRTGLGVAVPPGIDRALWPDRAAHTAEAVDFPALRGRRVAVIGAGPSAWDNAAAALEAGAAAVDMYVRRRALPQVNKGRGSATPGFFEGWGGLPAAAKWELLVYLHDQQSPPPHESVLRALQHPALAVHLGTPVRSARRSGRGVALTFDAGAAEADFLIVGTGFGVDLRRLPELAAVADQVALWADRYTPPPGLERAELGLFPWLGAGFELTERVPGRCPGLGRIHAFTHAATASLGAIASDIPGASTGAERLAHAMAAHFFAEDIAPIRATLEAFAEPELEATPFFVPSALPGLATG